MFGRLLLNAIWCSGVWAVPGVVLDLQNERLSVGYRARLLSAGQCLVQFCTQQNESPKLVLEQPQVANRVLVNFVQYLHDTRKPIWLATHAVLAVQTANRFLKGQLRPAWDSISSWKLSVPVKSRTPMDLSIMKAVFYFALCQAFMFEPSRRHVWLAFAICLRIGFYALLRPKEWFGLKRQHVKTPFGTLLSGRKVAVLTVTDPKNRAFMGRLQVRLIRDLATIEWLAWYVSSMAPADVLWPYSQQTFTKCFKEAMSFFSLGHLSLTPASLRAGGATWLLEQGVSLAAIRFAGGWASDKAMCCYLQEAEAASTLLSLSFSEQRRLEFSLKSLCFLERPPGTHIGTWLHGSAKSRRPLSKSCLAIGAGEREVGDVL